MKRILIPLSAILLCVAGDAQTGRTRGEERPGRGASATVHGMLVDASCMDRTLANLAEPPEKIPSPPKKNANATVEAERAGALQQQNPDVPARIADPTCAINGSTRGFAILLDNGRLLNVDEGGNTLVLAALQPRLYGSAGIKPKATLKGSIWDDRLIVRNVIKLE